jgi:hypothetical protein
VRATSGSDTTKLVCSNYPIMSSIAQNDLYVDRPLYRPTAVWPEDVNRFVKSYDPSIGMLTPDLPWTNSMVPAVGPTMYAELEAFTYGDIEALRMTYENMENLGLSGVGERFEILGPWDAPTMHQLINDGLKQCWLVVEVMAVPTPGATRHDLSLVAPWLQDPNHVRQVGVLSGSADRNVNDPFEAIVYGQVERDGGTLYFNTNGRTFADGDTLYLRCYKRAYDHCRAAGGTFGEQSGLYAETDEAPIERDWLVSSALVVGWRRFGHLLEVNANQRLIRDQAMAAAWFNDRTHQHFTAVQPQLLFRRARSFGPRAVA